MLRISILLFSFCRLYADILVNTFAGGAIPSGVPAQPVYLTSVAGTAWDPVGNLVFCDSTNHVIRRVRTDGIIETIAGTGVSGYSGDGGAASQALLNYPKQPRYDAAGNLYFYDSGNQRIRRIDTNGIVTTIAGNGIPFGAGMDLEGPAPVISLDSILDLAVDSSGNVYFSESGNRIRRVTAAGNVEVYAGTGVLSCYGCSNGDGGPATAAQLSPSWLALDGSGNLFFVDVEDLVWNIIRRISSDGTVTTFVPPPSPPSFSLVGSLAADQAGNLYAALGGSIVRYAPDGAGPAIVGGIGASSSLTVDSNGNVGFANGVTTSPVSSHPEIQEITAQGNVATLAGGSPISPPDGTPPLSAWFSPAAIAVSQSGDVYIADNQDCRIRKISAAGVLTTFAGTGTCGMATPSGNAKMADLFFPLNLAVDSQNNVWVIDRFLNVYSIAQDGTITLSPSKPPVTPPGVDQIVIDSEGRVYCQGLGSLIRILPDGTLQTIVAAPTIAGETLAVNSIGTDTQGNVYFGAIGSEIYRVNNDGTYMLVSETGNGPGPLAVDAAGNFWYASLDQFWVTGTNGTAILGSSQTGFSGDGGPAQDASFSSITMATAFAPNGDLYFIDGSRIRALSFTRATPPTPVIASGGIVNSANYTGGALAPDELISIFGSNFGATALQTNAPVNNSLSSSLGRTKVLFNSLAGAITAVTANQINVFVPYQFAGGSSVNVAVEVDDVISQPVTIPLAATAPGLFTADSSGTGELAALNQDGSVNSAVNPAQRGSVISLFGTGAGAMSPQLPNGAITISTPLPWFNNSVSVQIGGQAAQILYMGAAPSLATGVFQINAAIPSDIASGPAAVVVTIGGMSTTNSLSIAVQ
jgi:uncharacterized protein (TIGR03437 family)